jgi:general stress protein YciG
MAQSGKKRGFAALPAEKVREMAKKGGKSAHASGRAHEFTVEEARAAGAKGGRATADRRAQATPPKVGE